ncbi:DUF6268 family outer membrane beta-barrel protein [Saprospira sp. CCB-QB6]|uniref:DUF6268 family outer membrane beta-barrel protein n=1 Tax=Saprospira sp. CCB-QB6 TaxID=3023936 RepID=UPI002349C143|nr:DUF6268 family outer membrane beta-barrel protein [Saprospira sp. CCB-QB6]WCL81906.1 DUF6268 family outer membrane beta-barrel protein [Saprospira sp. CCB-QB6]
MSKIALYILGLGLCCSWSSLGAQSFILNRFFQPSLQLNADYQLPGAEQLEAPHIARFSAQLVVPIKSKLGLGIRWNKIWEVRKWQDLAKMGKIKAYQIFWTFKPQFTQLYPQAGLADSLGFMNPKGQQALGLQTGITGIHLIPKWRLLFYSFNLGMQQDISQLDRTQPYFQGAIGVVNFKRIFYYWYYGLAVSASADQAFPVLALPFIGTDLRLGKKTWWNITLPLQTRLQYKFNRYSKLDLLASLGSTGMGYPSPRTGQRLYFQQLHLRTGLALHLKSKKGWKLYLEGGYMPYRQLDILGQEHLVVPDLAPSPYFACSLYYGLRQKSLIGDQLQGLLNF